MKTFTVAALATGAFLSLASAQEQYHIEPDTVSSDNRDYWCQQQISQCPLICSQPPIESNDTPNTNTCDADNLTYDCECANGMQPNITQYTQTLPFFICQEWGNQCEKDCGDSTCASECRQKHPCGAQDPFKPNSSTISRTMSTSATASRTGVEAGATTNTDGETIFTGFGGASSTGDSGSAQESAASDSAGGRAAALEFGQTFGFVALAGAFFGGMALVL